MNPIKLYLAMSLSSVTSEEDRNEIRQLLKVASSIPGVQLLKWAFDVENWESEDVDDVFEYDVTRLLVADLAVFLFLNSAGSEGRGAEMAIRLLSGKPIVVIQKKDVTIRSFPFDGITKSFGLPIFVYDTIEQFDFLLKKKILDLVADPDSFIYKQPDYLVGVQDNSYDFAEALGQILQPST